VSIWELKKLRKSLGYTMGSMHGGISSEGLRMLDNFRRS